MTHLNPACLYLSNNQKDPGTLNCYLERPRWGISDPLELGGGACAFSSANLSPCLVRGQLVHPFAPYKPGPDCEGSCPGPGGETPGRENSPPPRRCLLRAATGGIFPFITLLITFPSRQEWSLSQAPHSCGALWVLNQCYMLINNRSFCSNSITPSYPLPLTIWHLLGQMRLRSKA